MRYCIATGGTGGHIYPALALVEEIKKNDPRCEVVFVGSENRMEAKEIPSAGYKFIPIQVSGMNGGVWQKVMSACQMAKAYGQCRKLMKTFQPDVVIGFGNYISVPVVLAAHHLKIMTMLHEQNSYAGKANRFLAKSADAIVGCYPENLNQFPPEKTRILGNPRATLAAQIKKDPEVLKQLGLDINKPLVVIVMGSLGSESVNAVMIQALSMMQNRFYQVLYVTGKNHYESVKNEAPVADNIKIVPYIDGCKVMINASLCVVRGGATTAAEITAMRMPSIIIPSPYVPNNHQVKNALALQEANAALMIEEKDLTDKTIVSKIEEILNDSIKRNEMAIHAKECGKPQASQDILAWINELKG